MKLQNIVTGFKAVDQSGDPQFYLEFLRAVEDLPDTQSIKRIMRDVANLQAGQHALDIGCGRGSEAVSMAQTAGSSGRVVGIDPSATMVEAAKKSAVDSAVIAEFHAGDAHSLTFADDSFDVCRSERVFMYLKDPKKAVNEIKRVLKPGGRVVIFDFDLDCGFVTGADKNITRALIRFISDSLPHGKIGIELPRIFHEAGFTNVKSIPHPMTFPLGFYRRLVSGIVHDAVRQGAVTQSDAQTWWSALENEHEKGLFRSGYLGFIVSAQKLA